MKYFDMFLLAALLAVITAVHGFIPVQGANNTPDVDLSVYSTPMLGAADIFGNGPYGPSPWPRPNNDIVEMFYCYWNLATKTALAGRVDPAINKWRDALGLPGPQNGHGLLIGEYLLQGFPAFCTMSANDDTWNPSIPTSIVAIIDIGPTGSSWGTVGYSSTNPIKPGQHHMKVTRDAPVDVIVHEFGHVLGMTHEHQRDDRDKYIFYSCNKAKGFDEAWKKAVEKHPGLDVNHFCDSFELMDEVGFGAGLGMIKSTISKHVITKSRGPYDVNSIMHYESSTYAVKELGCARDRVLNCPIAFWKDPNDRSKGVYGKFDYNTISPGDVQWVKDTYPWVQPSGETVG